MSLSFMPRVDSWFFLFLLKFSTLFLSRYRCDLQNYILKWKFKNICVYWLYNIWWGLKIYIYMIGTRNTPQAKFRYFYSFIYYLLHLFIGVSELEVKKKKNSSFIIKSSLAFSFLLFPIWNLFELGIGTLINWGYTLASQVGCYLYFIWSLLCLLSSKFESILHFFFTWIKNQNSLLNFYLEKKKKLPSKFDS